MNNHRFDDLDDYEPSTGDAIKMAALIVFALLSVAAGFALVMTWVMYWR